MRADRTMLPQFLADAGGRTDAGLNAVILDIALACRGITKAVTFRARHGHAESSDNEYADHVATTATTSALFVRAVEANTHVAGIWCDGVQSRPVSVARNRHAAYLVIFASLDQPSNLDINLPVGSIFSVLRAPAPGNAGAGDFLQAGSTQVCAGYALYGASTNLVFSSGAGVHGFTLDPALGEFLLSHTEVKIPTATNEIAVNMAHPSRWEPALKRYMGECLTGAGGARGRHFDVRGFPSLVAAVHRVLVRGGVFLCPRDIREPRAASHARLLDQANPIAFLVEQAGGRASTGRERVLDKVPQTPHEGVGLIVGAREEVERIEQYHRDNNVSAADAPLFGIRGLFRAPT